MKSKSALGALFKAAALRIAAADGQAGAPREPTSGDDVISLSEFRVATSAHNEYLAVDSITGTRVASKLSELPFAVNVVTSEFINDFVLLEFNEQLATVSGFSPNENENSYQLRGFAR